jgi:regulator of protease activity HflC (stomatin/prohibitin superfamily)
MMSIALLGLGVVLSLLILGLVPRLESVALRAIAALGAAVVLLAFMIASSVRYVGEGQVGIVVKNVGTKSLTEGRIIATDGQKGPQAKTLPPGWHLWYWPVIYDVRIERIVTVSDGEVGLVNALDGKPLPAGEVFAPEWGPEEFERMLDAQHFLTDGGGFRGPQTSVLKPGAYRFNTALFEVVKVPVTNIAQAMVGVVKSNVGPAPKLEARAEDALQSGLVPVGSRGIWGAAFGPQKLYLNSKAFEVTMIPTRKQIVQYAAARQEGAEREIIVRSSDGFTFPVDVRVEYEIRPDDAPLVVANFGGDGSNLQLNLHSAVRGIFRNNAERVRALDYVQQRSQQERQSLEMLSSEMRKVGVTITAVRIGDVGDVESLGQLLKTQTDREIAKQEQETFQEQQRAAEQQKALSRTTQEAEEEKRLATAQYEVKIAEREKEQAIIRAQAEAESIRITAESQAQAFGAIAAQIGQRNAAMIELLKVVGERGINITPRVMVSGATAAGPNSAGGDQAALMGTLLDMLLSREEEQRSTAAPAGDR